ncbi:hypothetical protein OHA25_61130 (plasmid) [Nonomuraea sp. NBC_00507]|uniref:hypothetical protein n=1 Tax=Nonomuraea sp. NBC_00507 TaxID=2976002 RepID=UPI002E19F873
MDDLTPEEAELIEAVQASVADQVAAVDRYEEAVQHLEAVLDLAPEPARSGRPRQ